MLEIIKATEDQVSFKATEFSLRQIASSGQCFRWYPFASNEFIIIHQGKILDIEEYYPDTFILHCSEIEFNEIWKNYFDFETDYHKFLDAVYESEDEFLLSSISCGMGIRILNQDPWESLITFIISQQNNIPRITGIIHRLCQACGEPVGTAYGDTYYSFPSAEQILDKYKSLKSVGVGFREKYIIEACKRVNAGYDLERLRHCSAEEAVKELKTFYGVGDKVANCVSLFGLGHKEAFPRDVWINRIIDKYYGGEFDTSRFEGFSGVIQQYMFHYERMIRE
ncbi:MAG: 8-oxoguanine DNA glycosylase [Lachnospiraceae bacterium]|nr:8-oxoguanine DNA glycosylase [Lachnospiraceae bacterium]